MGLPRPPRGPATAPPSRSIPSCDVAEEEIDTGAEARCFADWMRVHALEGTGGRTFSQMGRYLDADGQETNDPAEAAKDPASGQPVTNGAGSRSAASCPRGPGGSRGPEPVGSAA